MSVVQNKFLRHFLFSFGILSLVLAVIGAFLPLLPSVPFVLLSAWCFFKSSDKAYQKLLRQPYLGDAIRHWEQTRSISRRAKIMAITMILVSSTFMWMKVEILWLKISVSVFLAGVSVFIATRNER